MAYRRKGGTARATISEDFRSGMLEGQSAVGTAPPSSIAARAIRDSSAHGDSSLSSVYGQSAIASANRETNRQKVGNSGQDSTSYEYTSMNSLTESKNGFWGVLARKAKAFLEDEPVVQKFETYEREHPKMVDKKSVRPLQNNQSQQQPQIYSKMEVPPQKSSDSISSSLTYIGGTIKNALGEGLTIMESKTVDIIQETKKLHIRKKGGSQTEQNQALNKTSPKSFPQIQADYETQLKASRDVANAMAAKAKLLMREMKTVKADLAFAKERCTQLEEENKVLREGLEKGSNPEDDDLIRLQLETLLAEKGRLAHENSTYARENRFLREIVEYHQLTMQDVIYMDEGAEEVTEVCPIPPRSTLSTAPPRCSSPELASVIVPEDCPIVPMPPLPSPRPSNG